MNDVSRLPGRPTVSLDDSERVPIEPVEPKIRVGAIRGQVEDLAANVGRLRKRFEGDVYGTHLLDRIACSIEALDAALQPTAAAIYRKNSLCSLDDALAVECALEDVDRRRQHLQRLLGVRVAV